MADVVPDYAIGSKVWPGLAKLAEECGELQQVIGKLLAYPTGPHPDGGDPLTRRLEDEMADVAAAIDFLVGASNGLLFGARMRARQTAKYERFTGWHQEAGGDE